MDMRFLGRSGLSVSALSFGAMTFGGEGVLASFGSTLEKDAERIIAICLEHGINLFDTAEGYSSGRSEEILAHALGSRRQDVIIATKAWGSGSPGPNSVGASRLHIIQACEESLRRLRTDYIDLYQIHCFDAFTPLEETMRALDDLVTAGKVRYIGASNYAGWQLMKALAISDSGSLERYVSHQVYYSLVGRELENELIPLSIDQGVGILAWGPLAFGLLSGKFRRGQPDPEGARGTFTGAPVGGIDRARLDSITDVLAEIAAAREITMSQVALNYLLRKPGVTSVIIGARNEDQLRQNIAASAWTLSDAEMNQLDAVSNPLPSYPTWVQQNVFGVRNPKR